MDEECWGLKPAGDQVAWRSLLSSPCLWGSVPTSRVEAAWSLGELSWPETEGLEKALGTVPHDPRFLCGFLLQEAAGGWAGGSPWE